MRRLPLLAIATVCLTASAFSQVDIKITSLKAVGPDLVTAPALGDANYGVRVKWSVPKATKAYRVKFTVADRIGYISQNGNAGNFDYSYTFPMPLDGLIPYSVTVDVDLAINDPDRTNNTASGSFTPTTPSTAITYYNPKTLAARQDFTVNITKRASLTSLAILFGAPMTGTSQTVSTLSGPGNSSSVSTTPFSQACFATVMKPVPQGLSSLLQTVSFTAQTSAVKVNTAKITDTWASLSALSSSVSAFQAAEPAIQSTNATIVAYAKANLPTTYKTTTTPIQAARMLFQAVVRDLKFKATWNGTAVDALSGKTVDASGFSLLYVACLRAVGIPARVVSGYKLGTDQWHDWTEFYLPSCGWIPQDPTLSNSICENGSYAYYFGIVPELNQRVAVSRSMTNTTLGYTINASLQQPAYFYTYSAAAPTIGYTSHATLTVK